MIKCPLCQNKLLFCTKNKLSVILECEKCPILVEWCPTKKNLDERNIKLEEFTK